MEVISSLETVAEYFPTHWQKGVSADTLWSGDGNSLTASLY
jgi:hypothetical protein